MRHRRPDSVCESCVAVKRVKIGRSIGAARYPRTGVRYARRAEVEVWFYWQLSQ